MLSLSSQATDTPEDRNNPVLLYNKMPLETLNNNFTLEFDSRVKKIKNLKSTTSHATAYNALSLKKCNEIINFHFVLHCSYSGVQLDALY